MLIDQQYLRHFLLKAANVANKTTVRHTRSPPATIVWLRWWIFAVAASDDVACEMTLECTHRCFVHIDYEQRPVVPAESYSRRMMPLPHSTGLKMSKLWDTDRGSKRGHCFGTLVYKYMRPSKKKIQKVTHALGSNFKKKKVPDYQKKRFCGLKKDDAANS